MSSEQIAETLRYGPVRLARASAFSLGPVDVDPALRSVRFAGRTSSVEPRAMQVLVALAQAEGSVVSRDALVARCWDGRIVGDDAIYRAISLLRDLASGVSAGAFRIETISKVGYRLVVDPRAEAPATEAHPAEARAPTAAVMTQPVVTDSLARSWTRRAALGGAGATALGASLSIVARRESAADPFAALIAESENAERADMPDSSLKGVGFLEEAVAIQPSNPLGWGRLALALTQAAEYAPANRAGANVARAQQAAQRALALDPRQIDARAALAILPPYFGDWLAAGERLQEVLSLDPRHLPTIDARTFMHTGVGRSREASRDRLVWSKREPLHARFQYRLVYAHWNLGAMGEADRAADRALQLWPMHPGVWMVRLVTLAYTGRAERALAQVEDSAGRPAMPEPYVRILRLSMQALVSRTPADTDRATEALLAALETSPSVAISAIMMFNALGDLDRAFAVADAYLLEKGPLIASVRWREGEVSINDQRRRKTHMLFVPASAPMREDRRFGRLMDEVGLAEYWRAANVVPDYLIAA